MPQKKLFLIILMLLPACLQAQQQNPQVLFDNANELLQEGKIVQALNGYQQLVEREQFSGALFINMGYAYTQLGKLGKAKYYFLKAKRFDETQEKAVSGLNYVESQLRHQSVVLPTLFWEDALSWLQTTLGPAFLLGIGLILLNAGVFILIGNWFAEKPSSIITKTATGIAAAGILVLLLSFYIDYRQQRYSKAVMVTTAANVVEKPADDAALVNKAYEGYTFVVDHKKSEGHENRMFVEMSNGSQGWIQREEIMIL